MLQGEEDAVAWIENPRLTKQQTVSVVLKLVGVWLVVFGCFEVLSATILREPLGKKDSGRIMLFNPALNCWGDMQSITVCHLTITRFDLQI